MNKNQTEQKICLKQLELNGTKLATYLLTHSQMALMCESMNEMEKSRDSPDRFTYTEVRPHSYSKMETIEVSEFSMKLFKDAKARNQKRLITLLTDDEFMNVLVTVFNGSNWGK